MRVQKVKKNGKDIWQVELSAKKLGQRKRLYAPTREEALEKAKAAIEESGLDAAFALSPAARAVAARWTAPGRLTAEEVDAACREYSERKGMQATIADVIDDYLKAPRETELSREHINSRNSRLRIFREDYGDRKIATFTPGELGDFCRTRGRSAPNYFSSIRALFHYAHAREMIAANPFERMTTPALPPPEKLILTPDQMRKMLRLAGAEHDLFLRLLIFSGLCGLRHSEAMRMDCERIDRRTWEIHVTRMKTQRKGIRERYAHTEACAQQWLRWLDLPQEGQAVPIGENALRAGRAALAAAAGLSTWPHNALRRSFASYHLAAFGDAARTAEILGHTDAETTKSKYKVARQKEVALEWFALTPEAVLKEP